MKDYETDEQTEIEILEDDYDFELFLSTDGKHTVNVRAKTQAGKRHALKVATETFDYILARYGTKQGQAVKEYSKEREDKPQANQLTCKHESLKFAQSHTDKNPDRWFSTCKDCGRFMGWKS